MQPPWLRQQHIFVFALAWMSFGLVIACWESGPNYYGTLLPRDSDYAVGSNVSLHCLLNKTEILDFRSGERYKVNSSQLYFKFRGSILPQDLVKINTDNEAEYNIVGGRADQSGVYYCNVWLEPRKARAICPTNINFGYPPANLTEFMCRSIAFKELNCSWKAPDNPVFVNYTVTDISYVRPFECPKWKRNGCLWRMDTKPSYLRDGRPKLRFLIRGFNQLGNMTQFFEMDHYAIVIPGEVRSLLVSGKNSSSLTLSWLEPEGMGGTDFPPGVCYRLSYKSSYWTKYKTVEVGKSKVNFTLSGLLPDTWYTLRLSGRSCFLNETDLWSNDVVVSDLTPPDIPWFPPKASPISFDVVTLTNTRNVTLYWQPIPPEEQNAKNFSYLIVYTQTHRDRFRRSLGGTVERVKQSHHTFVNLDAHSAYEFLIYSVNEMGRSQQALEIIAARSDHMPNRPSNVRPVSRGFGHYTISWEAASNSSTPVTGYTVVWCEKDRPGDYRCEQHVDWKNVSAQLTEVELTLKDRNYDFAVAATTDNGMIGSGLEWAPCIVPINRALEKVHGVNAKPGGQKEMVVGWKLDCEAQKAVVSEYHIYVCPPIHNRCPTSCTSAGESQPIVVRDPKAESASVPNLRPFTYYGFSVVVLTNAGSSEESRVSCQRTLPGAPSDPPNNLHSVEVTNNSIRLSWQPPKQPNGIIAKYKIYFNDRTVDEGTSNRMLPLYSYVLTELESFTNYSITISACVQYQENQYCSERSAPLYVRTHIGAPGRMDAPRTEVLNSSHVRVTWKAPLEANGPLDLYLLQTYRKEGDNITWLEGINVTETSIVVNLDCPLDPSTTSSEIHLFKVFRVQAINLLDDGPQLLYGPLSNPSETRLCLMAKDINFGMLLGMIVGITLGLVILVLVLYMVIRWMKYKVDTMKDVKVELPEGLETPYSNDLNSYEKFKNGLTSRGSDSNLNNRPGLDRQPSFPDEHESHADDSFKNRHGSGASHFSAASTDELLGKHLPNGRVTAHGVNMHTATKGERNPSGDSSSGHDSLSSSLTHRTNLSSNESSSSAEESQPHHKDLRSSRDSGLDEEGKSPPTKGVKGPNSSTGHYLPAAPYSKLGMVEHGGGYLPISRGRYLSLYGHNLASSEPSITDLSPDVFYPQQQVPQDPPSPDVPYSKFGLSHSVSDLMQEELLGSPDAPPASSERSPQEPLPYSRFGLRRPPQKSPYVTVGMALMMAPQKNPHEILSCKAPPFIKKPAQKKTDLPLMGEPDGAYSKLGMGPKEPVLPTTKGYVTLQEVNSYDHNHLLPDVTISNSNESTSVQSPGKVLKPVSDNPSKNGYLPHQLIVPAKALEPVLPDVVDCSNVSMVLQEQPEVKVQGNNGYVTLNEALAKSTNV